MSNATYNKLWHDAQRDLEHLAAQDFVNQDAEPDRDRQLVKSTAFELYVRYITVSNRLEIVYDEMVQPQKRVLIRKLLDACLGRAIELKHDLVSIDMMEFSYDDAVMARLQLTPVDVEFRIPRYFHRERAQQIADRNQFINNLLIRFGWMEEAVVPEPMTEQEAIQLLQAHERARQGRLRCVWGRCNFQYITNDS